jgi:hypothetical protein
VLRAAVQRADAGRAVQLVAGERVEVAAIARTSTGRCEAACDPSTSTGTPLACAIATISSTGLIVPSAFERWMTASSLVRSEQALELLHPQLPASSIGTTRREAPCRSQSICHGTMLEWCSISVISTSSPAPRNAAAVGLRHEVDRFGGTPCG